MAIVRVLRRALPKVILLMCTFALIFLLLDWYGDRSKDRHPNELFDKEESRQDDDSIKNANDGDDSDEEGDETRSASK